MHRKYLDSFGLLKFQSNVCFCVARSAAQCTHRQEVHCRKLVRWNKGLFCTSCSKTHQSNIHKTAWIEAIYSKLIADRTWWRMAKSLKLNTHRQNEAHTRHTVTHLSNLERARTHLVGAQVTSFSSAGSDDVWAIYSTFNHVHEPVKQSVLLTSSDQIACSPRKLSRTTTQPTVLTKSLNVEASAVCLVVRCCCTEGGGGEGGRERWATGWYARCTMTI